MSNKKDKVDRYFEEGIGELIQTYQRIIPEFISNKDLFRRLQKATRAALKRGRTQNILNHFHQLPLEKRKEIIADLSQRADALGNKNVSTN